MNITFLIGNGFDINIGMKTRYSDFYEYYINLPDSEDFLLIKELKSSLRDNIDKWSDFELKFGEYCKFFKTIEDFDEVFDDVRDRLACYIKNEQQKYNFDVDHKMTMYKCLTNPEQFLPRADKEVIEAFKSNWKSLWDVNVISYNYSTSFENLLGSFDDPQSVGISGIKALIQFNPVKHIHGYSNKNMILGVNDISQVGNENFKGDPNVLSALVKPECNRVIKHLVDEDCKSIINKSNLICLFGLSIGDTDLIWWNYIANRLKFSDVKLIVFYRGDESIPELHGYKILRQEATIKDLFLSKTNLTNKEKELIRGKIYIGYNTDIFDIKLDKINK